MTVIQNLMGEPLNTNLIILNKGISCLQIGLCDQPCIWITQWNLEFSRINLIENVNLGFAGCIFKNWRFRKYLKPQLNDLIN